MNTRENILLFFFSKFAEEKRRGARTMEEETREKTVSFFLVFFFQNLFLFLSFLLFKSPASITRIRQYVQLFVQWGHPNRISTIHSSYRPLRSLSAAAKRRFDRGDQGRRSRKKVSFADARVRRYHRRDESNWKNKVSSGASSSPQNATTSQVSK